MKSYRAYNHEEIETITDKFTAGEFVTKDELKLWYAYKKAVKVEISNCQEYLKMAEKNRGDKPKSEITLEIEKEHQTAQQELSWIRSIKTFPLDDFCKFYELNWDYNALGDDRPSLIMAKRVIDGATESEQQLIREFLEESDVLDSINNYRNLTTPVALRRWTYMKRNATEYHPYISSDDATHLYDGREHYVYIQSECTIHRWGESYWISVDCDNTLYSLPVIKDFKEFDFQIGNFYKIICTDEIRWGNKKKYVMSIEESNEEEFMEKGLHQYATRW